MREIINGAIFGRNQPVDVQKGSYGCAQRRAGAYTYVWR